MSALALSETGDNGISMNGSSVDAVRSVSGEIDESGNLVITVNGVSGAGIPLGESLTEIDCTGDSTSTVPVTIVKSVDSCYLNINTMSDDHYEVIGNLKIKLNGLRVPYPEPYPFGSQHYSIYSCGPSRTDLETLMKEVLPSELRSAVSSSATRKLSELCTATIQLPGYGSTTAFGYFIFTIPNPDTVTYNGSTFVTSLNEDNVTNTTGTFYGLSIFALSPDY